MKAYLMVILDIIEGSPDHRRRSRVLRRLKNEDTVLQSTSRGDNRVLTYIMSESQISIPSSLIATLTTIPPSLSS